MIKFDQAKNILLVKEEQETLFDEDFLRKRIEFWRNIYYKEKNIKRANFRKKVYNGIYRIREGIYPITVHRPTFSSLNPIDKTYIRTYRMIIRGIMNYSISLMKILMKASGKDLGYSLVEKGAVKSIEDLPKIFLKQKIGLLDIVSESFNTMKINLYECMSCYGTSYIGIALCDFEAGVIEGVLEKLYGKNTTIEKYCWGLGYHFCGFESYFE
ncbi:MAG: hypothetical protein J7J82_05870 [Staphylothermus sp.]|nr:hypothetical protein [Staphylothermus sp.]